jgi:hypothetical protein
MRYCYLTLAFTVSLLACSTSNPAYCDGPDDCQGDDYCDIGGVISTLTNTCVPRPADNACNEVEQGKCDADEACLIVAGGENLCVECNEDIECGGQGRMCINNACTAASCQQTAAGDDACEATDNDRPVCGMNDECVECRTSDDCDDKSDTPVCVEASETCRACEKGFECTSGACNADDGSCVRRDEIVYVSTTGMDESGCGTFEDPCRTIPAALSELEDDTKAIVIRTGVYTEPVSIGTSIALIGEGAVNINPGLSGNDAAVTVLDMADVSFENIDIALDDGGTQTSVGLLCERLVNNSSLTFVDGTISGSNGVGVLVGHCDLELRRSKILANDRGGVSVEDSSFTIVNNFIAYNGDNTNPFAGVVLTGDAPTRVLDFNTIVGNTVAQDVNRVTGVFCNTITPTTGIGNIVYFGVDGGPAASDQCLWDYSNIEGGNTAGTGNIAVDNPPLLVTNAALDGDYHLVVDSPCINAVPPAVATPGTDIDGQVRPSPDNLQADCGADEFYP